MKKAGNIGESGFYEVLAEKYALWQAIAGAIQGWVICLYGRKSELYT